MYPDVQNDTPIGTVAATFIIMLVVCVVVYRYVWPAVCHAYWRCAKALYWALRNYHNKVSYGRPYHSISYHCKKEGK